MSGDLARPVPSIPARIDPAVAAGNLVAVGGMNSAPASSSGVSPLGLLRALKRRLLLGIALGLPLMVICGTAAWFLLPSSKFVATAKLRIQSHTPQVIFKTIDGGQEGGDSYKRYQKTQIAMLKSRTTVNSALRQSDVKTLKMVREKKDIDSWLLENLQVGIPADTEIMEISLSADDPKEAATLVNAISRVYREEVVGREQQNRVDRQLKLKELSKTYGEQLEKKRKSLRDLAQAAGSDDRQTLVLKQQYAIEHLSRIRSELLAVQAEKRKIESTLKVQRPENMQETSAPVYSAAELEGLISQHPEVAGLQERLSRIESQLASEMAHTGRVSRKAGMDPAIKALRDEVEELKRQLRKKRELVRPVALRQLQNPGIQQPSGKGVSLVQQKAIAEEMEKSLLEEIDQLSKVDHTLNANTLDLHDLQDDLKRTQDTEQKINQELEALTVELNAPARITLIEEASPPTTRDTKKWYMMFGMIVVGSFLAPLLGVAFLELSARKVDSVDEVSVDLGLPVVGSLPMLPARTLHNGVASTQPSDRYWYNVLLESIDATRTMLMFAAQNSSCQVVMITSALPGEGKTSLSTHLSTSLARAGKKTLLIDADLRCPSIHRLFDLTAEPGMSELLRGEVALEDAIASTAIEELKIITGGKCNAQTLRILSQGGMGAHFAQFKEQFDFVIVDSSPILPVADASIIAQQTDAVLFSVLTDVSRKNKILAAYQRLSSLGVKVLGAVVTGAHESAYGSKYYPGEASRSQGEIPSNEAETSS